MATIEDLKADLESYVRSVADIEFENSELKKRVAFLENDRELEGKIWLEKLTAGKETWREQALQHGRNQKQRTIVECEKVMQAFQSDLRTQQFTYQTKDSSLLLSSLLRAESSNETAEHQRRVYEAMAFTGATGATVTLQDYDIEDNHISLYNRTDLEVSLIGCCLKFSSSGAKYKFPDDTLIKPNSTLSLWYGSDAHSSIRHAKTAGSLFWDSNAAVTSDFTSTVDLVDKKGELFATVPANKERYPGAIKHGTESHVRLGGPSVLSGRHDLYLRFDHFHSLKNDAFGEPAFGHQTSIKRERDEEHAPDATAVVSHAATATHVSSSSSRKRPRRSSASTSSQPLVVATAHDSLALSVVTPIEEEPLPVSTEMVPAIADKHQPSVWGERVKAADAGSHFTPLSIWNVRALSLSLRPYLLSRNQGCLLIKRVLRRDDKKSAVAVCISNIGDKTVDLSGWRLFAMGNPSQELFLPADAHVNAGSELTLISDMDEETLLWAQVASSPLAAITSAVTSSPSDDLSAFGVAPVCGETKDNGPPEVSEDIVRRKSRRSSVRGNHHTSPTALPPAVSASKIECKGIEMISDPVGTEGPQIVVVAGLRSLSKGDVLSIHLIDRSGHNICMIHGETRGMPADVGVGPFRGQGTVFGDSCEEAASTGKGHFLPSLPSISGMALIPHPDNCAVM